MFGYVDALGVIPLLVPAWEALLYSSRGQGCDAPTTFVAAKQPPPHGRSLSLPLRSMTGALCERHEVWWGPSPDQMPLKHMPLSFAESVDFDFHDFPAECSAASVSGSSYASSSFGPLTPTSGRSTPSFSTSLDMGSSFASSVDTVPFDMTPPSSATSTYFPTTPKMDSLPDFAYRAFPTTLSRGQPGHPVYPLGGYDAQLTPSHTMDGGFFLNQLGPSPLPLMSTPSAPTHFGHPPESAWGHADSLISFEQQVPRDLPEVLSSSIKLEPQNDVMTPLLLADTARKRAKMEEARHKTTALDQAQQRTQASARRQVKRERRLCALKGKESTMSVDSVEPRSKFHCPHPGCTFGPYQRKEHLMRHIDS